MANETIWIGVKMKEVTKCFGFVIILILLAVISIYFSVNINISIQDERAKYQLARIKNGEQWVEYDSQGNPFWVYKKD